MKFYFFLLPVFSFMIISCTEEKKEDPLKEREAILLMKEKEFEAKNQEFEELKAMRDSLHHSSDSVQVSIIPDQLLGKWSGKMICTESNCSEHVIGDQRNDVWEFLPENVVITNKTGGEKTYAATFTGADLKLVSDPASASRTQTVIILQRLEDKPDRLKGTRESTGADCVAKFSIDLEKLKN